MLEFPRDRFSSQRSLQLILAIWLRKTIYRKSFNSRQPSKGYMWFTPLLDLNNYFYSFLIVIYSRMKSQKFTSFQIKLNEEK